MDGISILICVMLPLAFLHGYYSGNKTGIRQGAERMFDSIWRNGTPKVGEPKVRIIEITDE